ncbi:IucA/IucC family siderophore biosynthesis protein [Streptomyces sp. P38-E01]|uniref:IucA/IucC family siderophore biosynthesis protein n=1 Tax=Streptomyces tardus TaxID=2780544 RepID=A0A949JHW1_9ACTN|nr:IucA/IucC family siderophore biosynthesis protein [Streptomyces tardus]MBU7599757.1 IucA/IucC family siderophore biosynthesis protein [Streptomyces tardus]
MSTDHQQTVPHLTPELWDRAGRLLIRKALAEFAHERLLHPAEETAGHYVVTSDDGRSAYRFTATRGALDHWRIDPDSITRERDGSPLPLDALDFFLELRSSLGLTEEVLPVYLEEISSTLASTAYKLEHRRLTAAQLAEADFQTVEAGMTEGHPCFVANNGRLGFGSHEYLDYAPEAASPVRLVWLAARRDRATFTSSHDLDHRTLITEELGPDLLRRFRDRLTALGLDPEDYLLMPVHPWQWRHKISVTFAAELAHRRLVHLGEGDDTYQAQQSIRTFFNTSDPGKHYVKTALSVLNMGFVRGLSAAYMKATPAINDWLARLIADDELLRATGVRVIRERAAIGYENREYAAAADKSSPYPKMLAALWRESPVPALAPGRRLVTMASLLHTDQQGHSLAAALIRSSGLEPAQWLRHYLRAYLTPLLHSFYAYDLVYMPHGENIILVLRDGVPESAILKDIAEEIAVLDPTAVLPPEVERIRADVPDEMKLLSLFTDVFDCFFRFLGATLDAEGTLPEDAFWAGVAECVRDYQESAPQFAAKFEQYDLFAAEFARSCLNRLQLRDNTQMVDLQDPASAIQISGTLHNPLAVHARTREPSAT